MLADYLQKQLDAFELALQDKSNTITQRYADQHIELLLSTYPEIKEKVTELRMKYMHGVLVDGSPLPEHEGIDIGRLAADPTYNPLKKIADAQRSAKKKADKEKLDAEKKANPKLTDQSKSAEVSATPEELMAAFDGDLDKLRQHINKKAGLDIKSVKIMVLWKAWNENLEKIKA
jgi:hypothetical protein